MDKVSPKSKTCTSPAWRGRECNSSTSGLSPVSAEDGQTKKRKASPDQETQRKKTRVSETGLPPTIRGGKRKSREDGEGPSEKKRRTDPLEVETVSTSMDTGKETLHKCGAKETKKSTKGDFFSRLATFLQRAQFNAKYQEQNQLGEGGFGCVFAGFRKKDNMPVAIKHIPKEKVVCKHVAKNGKVTPTEVTMLKLAAPNNGFVGTSAPVFLLDWYDLGQEIILVLERPVPVKDLFDYVVSKKDPTEEEEAKIILKQLVEAAIDLQDRKIFHRDIKMENILIETGSDVPRARLIDFGLSCFAERWSSFSRFYGTLKYAPPEWFQTRTYSAGPTTVWQLGALMFEMLHKTMFQMKRLKIRAELSENCQDFLCACLNMDPQQRLTLEQLQTHPWLS